MSKRPEPTDAGRSRGRCAVARAAAAVGTAALALVVLLGSCAVETLAEDPGENLVLITIDGARVREMFYTPDPTLSGGDVAPAFPLLHESLGSGGVIYGDPTAFDTMTTANDAQVSIPGYMSIFTGYEQPCYDNQCARVGVETVFEYVQRRRGFARGEIAVFASWKKIDRALQHVEGTIYADIGPTPGQVDVPPWSARWDRDTVAAAMDYLETRRPRLLYIALLDADGWGHQVDANQQHDRYAEYLAALRQDDQWIAEVKTRLAGMGEYGARTTVIVTTDHGRGDAQFWGEHNSTLPGSERVWLHATGPHVTPRATPTGAQLRTSGDIRPTIEVLFGLPPSTCTRCGAALAEVVGAVP